MKLNLGYRAMLDIEQEAYDMLFDKVPCPDYVRVGTWIICSTCSKPYVDHPYLIPHYFLNLLCDGRVVKL